MTVQEIHENLLAALSKIAEQHATIVRNPLPGHEALLRDIELQRLAAQVTVAKLMCAVAGIQEDLIRLVVDAHYIAQHICAQSLER